MPNRDRRLRRRSIDVHGDRQRGRRDGVRHERRVRGRVLHLVRRWCPVHSARRPVPDRDHVVQYGAADLRLDRQRRGHDVVRDERDLLRRRVRDVHHDDWRDRAVHDGPRVHRLMQRWADFVWKHMRRHDEQRQRMRTVVPGLFDRGLLQLSVF